MIHYLYLSTIEMLAFAADLHTLEGCISCLFSTGPYVTSYALGAYLLSRVHPIMLGLSWSLYDLCLLDRMLPCLATGLIGRSCISFLCLVVFVCQFLSASFAVAKLRFRVAEQ
jgi:hypothetical protein